MVGFIFHHCDIIDKSRIGKLDSKPFSILEKYIRFFIIPFICLIILTGCATKLEGSKFVVEEANFHQQYGYYTSSTGLKIIPIDVEISKADEIKLYNKVSSVREEYIQLKEII